MPIGENIVRCGSRLLDLSRPKVMGILNTSPDSFYDGGKWISETKALEQIAQMLKEGASIIDIGGVSTRPGAAPVSPETEFQRVIPLLRAALRSFPEALLSVDTFRADVAKAAAQEGAHIINDVSAGRWDENLLPVVAKLDVAYILMHAQGQPQTMQQNPHYEDVVLEVNDFFIEQVAQLKKLGIHNIILDVGFGFGKTLQHNYRLLQNLHLYQQLGFPVLAGLSRKSMIWKLLDCSPQEALNGTSVLNFAALQQGAKLLRVHDVKEASQTIKLWEKMMDNENSSSSFPINI